MRYRVTIRGDGTELRGYATEEALEALADDPSDPFIVIASPAASDYNPFKLLEELTRPETPGDDDQRV